MNEHDAPRLPPTRADQHNTFDEIAERVVAAGGGTQAVLDANELGTLKQVVDLIDPAIPIRAFANDALQLPQPSVALKPRPRPRRLVPDAALIRRRAAGEPLASSPTTTTLTTPPSAATSPDPKSTGSSNTPAGSYAPSSEPARQAPLRPAAPQLTGRPM